jgi:hypothetical protein
MQFSVPGTGSTIPSHLNLSGASMGTLTGLTTAIWSIDTSNASSGSLSITSSGELISSGTAITLPLLGITNSYNNDCQPADTSLADTCTVAITTYSAAGSTVVDTGTTSYTVVEDANLNLLIEGIPSGEIHNGITSTTTSTSTSLPFGFIGPGGVRYVSQKLTITTNAPGGFTVYAVLADTIEGQYTHNFISPFGATNATWATPQTWSTPTGTTSGVNTGWFGANITDTSVTGWSGSTSSKFGPLGNSPQPVAYSSGPALSGKVVYVSYALGVNSKQPADTYVGNIVYSIVPIY